MELREKKFFSSNEAICLRNYDGMALCRGWTRDAEKKKTSWFSASSESAKVFSDSWLQDYDRLVRCSVLIPKFSLGLVGPQNNMRVSRKNPQKEQETKKSTNQTETKAVWRECRVKQQ